MPNDLISTDAEHEAALREIERLWNTPRGTPDGNRLDALLDAVEAYEEEHFPIDQPDVS